MSGPDNLRGVDYQISCSVLEILRLFASRTRIAFVAFESLDDDGEDLAITFEDDKRLQVQIKKQVEGYNWSASKLRPILQKFSGYQNDVECEFITDGPLPREIVNLKPYLADHKWKGEFDITTLLSDELTEEQVRRLRGRTRIRSRYLPSDNEDDPAKFVRTEIHNSLTTGPFTLSQEPAIVESSLWKTVFELGKLGSQISGDDLTATFARCGVVVSRKIWSVYPSAEKYYSHSFEIETLLSLSSRIIIIWGISGIGKTAMMAEIANQCKNHGQMGYWLTINELVDTKAVIGTISDYFNECGLSHLGRMMRSSEQYEWPALIADSIRNYPVSIFIDRIESSNSHLLALISETVKLLDGVDIAGRLFITSTILPDWWPKSGGNFYAAQLSSLPKHSGVQLLSDAQIGRDDSERERLVEIVGQHVQSLILLKTLPNSSELDFDQLTTFGTEASRNWLVRRVLSTLPEREKRGIAMASVFSYQPHIELITLLINDLVVDVLRILESKALIKIRMSHVSVHDFIRVAALDLMSDLEIKRAHQTVANAIGQQIKQKIIRDDEFDYDTAKQWALHVEASDHDNAALTQTQKILLECNPDQLAALFAIRRHGYPFDFSGLDLEYSVKLIEQLLEKGLIVENTNLDEEYGEDPPLYLLSSFDIMDICLLDGMVLYKDYGNHLGYYHTLSPNFAFEMQCQIICPWEHCIELFPLPPMTLKEWENAVQSARERLASPEGLTPEQVTILENRTKEERPSWVADTADEELEAASCLFFGHICPGGLSQARLCRQNEGDSFLWAFE
jgi:hypothetical protein